jgi:hypothetical protein
VAITDDDRQLTANNRPMGHAFECPIDGQFQTFNLRLNFIIGQTSLLFFASKQLFGVICKPFSM